MLSWVFCAGGVFFVLAAKRLGCELANGLTEPNDPGAILVAYGAWFGVQQLLGLR